MNIDRINKNEERLDKAILSIKELENALEIFKKNKKDINLLNKYYGSPNWFKDKEDYEKEKTHKVKAGVLSEDSVWNLNEEIAETIEEMKTIVESFKKNK